MKTLKIELWNLAKHKKSNKINIENIYYIYKVNEDVLEKLLNIKYYKDNLSFMPLDRKYAHEFKLIKTNENIKNVDDYEVLDIDSQNIYIDDELINFDREI